MSKRIKSRIEQYFIENGPCRGSEVRCRFGIPKSTWGVYLHELREEGRLKRVGEEMVKGKCYPVYAANGTQSIDTFLARPAPVQRGWE